jgi:superfamily I DNA and/or RNA helicase
MNQIEINGAEFRKYESRDAKALKELYGQFVKYHSKLDSSFSKVKGHEDMFNNWVESSISNDTFNCMMWFNDDGH